MIAARTTMPQKMPGPSAPARAAREAVVAFLALDHGIVKAQHLRAWAVHHLLQPGFLRISVGSPHLFVQEYGAGRLSLPVNGEVPERDCAVLFFAAKQRFLESAYESHRSGCITFALTAMHRKRVVRERENGIARWTAELDERDSLSDHLIALLAVDVLARPERYVRTLSLCEPCTLKASGHSAPALGPCVFRSLVPALDERDAALPSGVACSGIDVDDTAVQCRRRPH